jgi:hypothetical protein
VPALNPNEERPENCYCSTLLAAVDHAFHVMGAGCGRLNFPTRRAEVSDTLIFRPCCPLLIAR